MSALGASVRDQFEVLEYLGKSGKVVKARQRALDRLVVIKVLNPKFFDAPKARDHLLEEARLLARITHPNVVGVYGVETPAGEDPYLVMECAEGTTLKAVLKERQGPVPFKEALRWMDGLLSALSAIHEAGIVHRNLKPENLLIDPQGKVKLLDFALALTGGSSGEASGDVVLGTPIYMSPEQVRGKPLDARSDLYAAGVIFFELLTGRPPFVGKDPREIMKAHAREALPDPAEWDRPLARPVMHVLKRALAKKPDERYESAQKLRERVAALASAGDDPRDVSQALKVEARRLGLKRERSAAAGKLLGGVLALAMVGAGVSFWLEAARSVDVAGGGSRGLKAEASRGLVVFTWETPRPTATWLEYGYESPSLVLRRNEEVTSHRVELRDLAPGRSVRYRVRGADGKPGETRQLVLPTSWSIASLSLVPGVTEARLGFRTEFPCRPRVLVSTEKEARSYFRPEGGEPATEHSLVLGPLSAATRYRLRVELEEPGRSPEWEEREFQTSEVTAERVFAAREGAPLGAAPLASGSLLLVGTAKGEVVGIERATGREAWREQETAPVGGMTEVEIPAVGGKPAGLAAVMRTGESGLTARDPLTGRKLWARDLGAPLFGVPASGGGVVVVALRSGELVAVHPANGFTLWTAKAGAAPTSSPGVDPRPEAFELVAGFEDGLVRGFGPGGRALWSQAFGAPPEGRPVFQASGVAMAGQGRYLRMRESRKAPRVTLEPGKGVYGLALAETATGWVVVLAGRGHGLQGFEWDSGRALWDLALPGGATGEPRIAAGRVYVATGDGAVACASLAKGELLWTAKVGGAAVDGAVPTPEGCFVATFGGAVYRFRDQ